METRTSRPLVRKSIAWASLLFIALALGFVLAVHILWSRSRACHRLPLPSSRAAVQAVLGPPVQVESEWLLFRGDSINADSFIHARLQPDGTVTELWCNGFP